MLPKRSLKKLADDQCSSVTKGNIWHIKHYVHTTSRERNNFEIGRLIKISIMFNICTYCVFTLYGRIGLPYFLQAKCAEHPFCPTK